MQSVPHFKQIMRRRRRIQAGKYQNKVLSYDPIAYWPLTEHSGTVAHCLVNGAQNGTYSSDVSAMGIGTGIGDGNDAPYFDGTNDYVNIYSATFNTAFNGAEGSLSMWLRVGAAGVWTDATDRRFLSLRVDGNNYIIMQRVGANNNRVTTTYNAGAVGKTITHDGLSSTDWMHWAATWSKSSGATGEVKFYYNGSQVGATLDNLGVWAGNLSNTLTTIGAASTIPSAVWSGYAAHVAIWNTPLTAVQIANLATV